MYSLWKRKSLLLALLVLSSFLILAVQYNSISPNSGLSGSGSDGFTRPRPLVHYNRLEAVNSGTPRLHPLSAVATSSEVVKSKSDVPKINSQQLQASQHNAVVHDSKSSHLLQSHQTVLHSSSERMDQPMESDVHPINSDNNSQKQPHASVDQNLDTAVAAEGAAGAVAASRDTSAGVQGIAMTQHPYIPAQRLVHLDLKGAPPKISYLKQIFPLLKAAGATGILIEYEDMFPFSGNLKAAAAGNAYTMDDIQAILTLCKIHHFEVIPLVQTFGHMEHFLKLEEWRGLREVDEHPQAICPSRNSSWALVTEIIDQVMALHGGSSHWLHIGCDEVFHVGYCSLCRYKDREQLILNHVARVAQYVREKHGVTPIIWHDMLAQMSADRIRDAGLNRWGVEIMVWSYVKDLYRFLPWSMWSIFSDVFPTVWGASAFKGAFGETLIVPNSKWHLENNQAWLEVS